MRPRRKTGAKVFYKIENKKDSFPVLPFGSENCWAPSQCTLFPVGQKTAVGLRPNVPMLPILFPVGQKTVGIRLNAINSNVVFFCKVTNHEYRPSNPTPCNVMQYTPTPIPEPQLNEVWTDFSLSFSSSSAPHSSL
uniref:Uncharacterized protein n=1 Tax=Cacopsylla melanoneura TaxID=428564 RepID=A0A8D8TYH4_9HEMI